MELNLYELASNVGGIGGLFAMIMFVVYRQTIKQMREDRKYAEDRLTKLLEDDQESRKDNTEALTQLTTYLKNKNGNH